jgi:hypothetical protein
LDFRLLTFDFRLRSAEWKSAAIKVVSAAGVLGALLALYAHEIKVETQVRELVAGPQISQTLRAGGAQGALAKDTPAGWLQAESRLAQALEMQPSNPVALASLAVAQQLLAADGFADRGAKADEATARAEARDVSLAERHQARALGLLRAGRAVDAENYLRPLVEKFPGH